MENINYSLIISSIIIMIGWFVTNFFNRRHEISKIRMEYRLKTLESFLPVYISMSLSKNPYKDDKDLDNKVRNASINFQLYGYKDEIKLFGEFTTALEKANVDNANTTLDKLIKLTRQRLRKELKLPALDITKQSR